MRFLSVCSGIGADAVAWHPLGWECAAFAEIDPFANTVLAHHYPEIPNHGDFTRISEHEPVALVVGGTPCQSFSGSGRREGLDDHRGNLAIEYIRLVDRIRPRWFVWENVPGVLWNDEGRTFGTILGEMGRVGYGLAWRVLDAQYVRVEPFPRAVPQRRRRVFVVGHSGDWRPPVAVLFEPEGLRGSAPPQRRPREKCTPPFTRAIGTGGGRSGTLDDVFVTQPAVTVPATAGLGNAGANEAQKCTFVAHERRKEVAMTMGQKPNRPNHNETLVVYGGNFREGGNDVATTLNTKPHRLDLETETFITVSESAKVRRITPLEAERLQGFPDGYTRVPYRNRPMSDSARYRMVGNAIAVNVLRWLGERIRLFEECAT